MATYKISDDENAYGMQNLARIKENISQSYLYFQDNYNRFRDFRRYIFKETVNDQQKSFLRKLNRPVLEFNILEAPVSRLLGEFAKHEPSIYITPSEGVPVKSEVIKFAEDHFRHALYVANKDNFAWDVYKDVLTGGFSAAKVCNDFASPMSFKQNIYIYKCFDPTLVGFDPIARASHKGDGNYCFEIFPMTEKDFEQELPGKDIKSIKYQTYTNAQDIEGFKWSYKDIQSNKIILLADYYEKKKIRTRIVQLSNGMVLTNKNYKRFEEEWRKREIAGQIIEQIPKVVSKRWTIREVICRYRLIENQVIEYEETDYSFLPIVFIDGNSAILTSNNVNATYQMTRPYVYHGKGIQDMKNFAGQSLANYLNNLNQNKFIIKKESIPQDDDSLESFKNVQRASNIIINAYSENNPDKPIPDPVIPVMNPSAPPEIMNTFGISEQTLQSILGGFGSNFGKDDAGLSGKAIIESLSIDNAAAMPYVVGYLQGLTQIANIFVDLLPKYLIGEREVPVMDKDGNKNYVSINREDTFSVDYAERALKVNIEAGINFQTQKNRAVQQIIALSQAMPSFAEFMNSAEGLPILIKNLDIYGADSLAEQVEPWLQRKQQQQEMMMQQQQQAMMQSPQMIRAQAEMQKVQLEAQNNAFEQQMEIAKQATNDKLADAKLLESEARISNEQINSAIKLEESNNSIERHALDAAVKFAEIQDREQARSQ